MTDKDSKFISALISATEQGRVKWELTAVEDEYTTSFRGKFSVLTKKAAPDWYGVRVLDPGEREMLEYHGQPNDLSYDDWTALRNLFDLARRNALAVDEAIDDFIKEIGAM